jgi:hypothetical protein
MRQHGLFLAAILMASLSLVSTSFGADGDMAEVLARLKALEMKNKDLETKLKQAEARPRTTAAIDKAMAAEEAKMGAVITAPDPHNRPLKIGGYLDFSYQYNFNRPDNFKNNLRVFDNNDPNGFNLHLAEINFERLPTCAGQAGFRIDLDYGTDQRVFGSQDNTADNSLRGTQIKDVDLQQAYIEYIAPIGSGITIDAGKFVTWAGSEVIEASDNINSSRSILFGYAIPFAHTGFRATYTPFKDKWTIGAGIVNGWDNIQDQNNAKTFMFMSNWTPVKWFNWVVVGIVGDEQTVDERARLAAATASPSLANPDGGGFDDLTDPAVPGNTALFGGKIWDSHDHGARALIDTTMTFTPWDKFTFAINADYAHEGGVPKFNGPGNRTWWGVAGYLKYQFLKNWYVANRTEYFNDEQGVRTGRAQTLWESTLTVDWALSDPLHVRFEYRHDDSNVNSFSDSRGVRQNATDLNRGGNNHDKQDTIMMQWLYKF